MSFSEEQDQRKLSLAAAANRMLREAREAAANENRRPYRVKLEENAQGNWTGVIVGPGIDFPEIVWGETQAEAADEARKRVEWIKARPEAVEYEL